MDTITQQPVLSESGRSIGTSYFMGEIELHLPTSGRPEVYVGTETIDAGLLAIILPDLVKLYADPTVRAQILSACANA
jgi:hypothetical protein